jgi:hypothetical protein
LNQTIHAVQASLALENPFPDTMEQNVVIKKQMRSTVKGLVREFGVEYQSILDRLKSDGQYASLLAVPVSVF